jgi:hypothetical protein
MAIATGTATLIAAGVGLAATGVTTGMSFSQANKQKKLQSQAEAEADKMMAAARARLDVNYMDALSVQKEPYERQREMMVSQGAQAIDTSAESERGVAATAGRVYMGQKEAQGDIRTAMGKELTEIERLKVAEDARLRDLNVQLDLGEVEGKQMQAADAQRLAAQATTEGLEGVTSMATQAANMIPLYPNLGGKEAVAGTLKNTTGIFPNPTPTPQTYKTPDWMSWANISRQNQGIFPNAGAQVPTTTTPNWLQWPYTPQ